MMFRRIAKKRTLFIIVVLAIVFLSNTYIGSKYMVMMPGITEDLSEIVEVEGGNKNKPGSFLLTAVTSRSANLPLYLYSFIKQEIDLLPREEVIPEGWDMNEYIDYMQQWMAESQKVAEVVALKEAGYEPLIHGEGAQVVKLTKDSPARGFLKEGDIIMMAEDNEIRLAEDLVRVVTSYDIGKKVKLDVLRNNKKLQLEVDTIESESQKGKAAIGVYVTTFKWRPELPIDIKIRTGEIGGPSAGAMFVLEILNQLTEQNLTSGRIVAGTGTVDLTGKIGEIGGVVQKVYTAHRDGATVFFTPAGNADDALKAGKKLNIEVVPVETVKECIDYLKNGSLQPI
jgi:PDZ domain-containing protein